MDAGLVGDERRATLAADQLKAAPFDLYDVEVMKGPQGTLYGASALNGAVRYVPNRPQFDTFEARYFPSLPGDSIRPGRSRLASCFDGSLATCAAMPPAEIPLIWVKRTQQDWCKLFELDLALIRTYGVYVLWHGGHPSRVVRIGHGDIATELRACCNDRRVILHLADGPLFVTWAAADAADASGIHLHLADRLRPLIEDRAASNVVPVAARAPF